MNKYNQYLQVFNNNSLNEKTDKLGYQEDWEIILAGYLLENNIDLKRHKDDLHYLDFYFQNGTDNIHIEAVAPTAGNANNKVKEVPVINKLSEQMDFESGIRDDDKILARFTNCIVNKIRQANTKNIPNTDSIILAINTDKILGSWESSEEMPIILRCLYGISAPFITRDGAMGYTYCDELTKKDSTSKIKLGYFKEHLFPFSGIICSGITKDKINYSGISSKDFIYYQNPLKPDLRNVFAKIMTIDDTNFQQKSTD